MFRRNSRFFVMGLGLFFAFTLAACSGGNSSDTRAEAEVYAVEVSDNGSTATMEVSFSLSDDGTALSGVAADDIRFTVAKLIPAASPSSWQSYINRLRDDIAIQATYERASTTGGVFIDNGDGTYSYEFSFNFRAVTDPADVTYDPSLTHRIGMQVSGNVSNAIYDFVPKNQDATPDTRSIVDNVSCSQCHEPFRFHGTRVAIKYCVTCHNPGTEYLNDDGALATVDFKVMVHKIHRGANLPEVQDGGTYAIGSHDYSKVVFPQDVNNCIKCHDNTNSATPDADNWKNEPSVATCTACHDAPDSGEYPTFPVLEAAEIETAHVTANPTPNNPNLPPGVPRIEYVLNSATVNGANQAVINFQILRDGVPLDFYDMDADLSSWPDFYLAYALPQDGITKPTEYNNLGVSSGQRVNVDIDQLGPVNNNDGTMVDKGDGTFTATTGGTTFPIGAFPAGATLRGVGLAGYMHVDVDGDDYSLHTPSKVIAVSGDDARREVVDSNKCAKCHEWFEGHGGSRVRNMQICVFCHNPNLSSSGREIAVPDPRLTDPPPDGAGLSADALTYPEATNNFKDMIHGIHGGETRTTDYEFVRNRSNGYYYNWSEVVFPGRAGNCLTCHKPGTYTVPLVDDTLFTTNRTTGVADGQDATVADVSTAQDNVPNATDWVITPTAAACYACHDDPALAQTHMKQNGALIDVNRNYPQLGTTVEQCSLCHGTGKIADLAVVHAAEEFTLIATITAPATGGPGGESQVGLCGPGSIGAQPAGHTDSLSCCSCHSFK